MVMSQEPLEIEGNGTFDFPIVGESYRQETIARLCGGKTAAGITEKLVAVLEPEDENLHDANAVAVKIEGELVGYLSRASAVSYRTRVIKAFGDIRPAKVQAMIVGGWDRGGDDVGHFGVKLDLPRGRLRDRPDPGGVKLNDHGQPVQRFNDPWLLDQQVDELIGWCHGTLCDGEVNQHEAVALERWVQAHPDAMKSWHARMLAERVRKILADGVAEPAELEELAAFLHDLVAGRVAAPERTSTSLPLDEPPPDIAFQGRRFVFTGQFMYGTRAQCEAAVTSRGGEALKDVRRDLDYLVIGTMASRDWIHSSWGRKVERALNLRDNDSSLKIVCEKHWTGFLTP
jgi:hypothetical protein